MVPTPHARPHRATSFGRERLTVLERLGVWLSHRAIARVIRGYDRPRLLDLGSGYRCRLIAQFRDRLGAATAVDLALDPALAGVAALTCVESPIEAAWPLLPRGAFDIVALINVLEHTWEPQRVLDEAAARLRPGGTLVVNVPTWLGRPVHELQAFRLGLSSAVEIDDHKHYFDTRDLWPLLVRAGFKPSAIRVRTHKLRLNLFATACRA